MRKSAANWVMTEVLRAANESAKPLTEAAPKPRETGALLKMVEDSRISLNAAKSAFAAMCRSGKRCGGNRRGTRSCAGLRRSSDRRGLRSSAGGGEAPRSPSTAPAATSYTDFSSAR